MILGARESSADLGIGGVLSGAFDLGSNGSSRGVTGGRGSDAGSLGKADSANSKQATGGDRGMKGIVGN